MRRASRTFLGRAALAAALLAAVACAACSGDDTEGLQPTDAGADATHGGDSGGPVTADGGGDASLHDAAAGDSSAADAGDAWVADAAPPQLACTTWRYTTPIVLEDLSSDASAGFYTGRLWVGEPTAGQVSVITHPSNGPTFRIYDLNKASSAVTTLGPSYEAGAPADATYESARHFVSVNGQPVTQVLVQQDASYLTAYLVPDALAASGPLPLPMGLSSSGYSFAALAFETGDVFVAAAYEHLLVSPEIDYALGVGVATPTTPTTLSEVELSASDEDFEGLALAHENGNVYVFASNDPTTEGASAWVVPDDAGVPAPLTARAFDTAANARLIDVAAGAVGGTTNIAHAQGGVDGAPLVILAGQLQPSELATVTTANLATVRTYDDPAAAPFVHASAEWAGDDLMLISPGLPGSDGGAPMGANVLWLDAHGYVRSEEVGANAVLQTSGASITSIVASPASVTPTAATWDVAWIDSRGAGEVLLYNELDCE